MFVLTANWEKFLLSKVDFQRKKRSSSSNICLQLHRCKLLAIFAVKNRIYKSEMLLYETLDIAQNIFV